MIETTKSRKAEQQQGDVFAGQSYDHEAYPDDFVCDVLHLVCQMVPNITGKLAAQVDAALRERWGQSRPYIALRLGQGRSERNERIRRDYLAGERLELLERRYGITSRRILQIIKA
jgi:Mor family transcriptional regulator